MTRDYKPHSAIELFAVMNVPSGGVLYNTSRLHKATDVLAFFELVDLYVPRHLKVHVALHNLSAHKPEPTVTWLALRRSARWHLHFTPTSSSSLHLLAGRFSLLTAPRLPRAPFNSVDDLPIALETSAEHWNDDPESFLCKNPADETISKMKKGRSSLTSVRSATPHH